MTKVIKIIISNHLAIKGKINYLFKQIILYKIIIFIYVSNKLVLYNKIKNKKKLYYIYFLQIYIILSASPLINLPSGS